MSDKKVCMQQELLGLDVIYLETAAGLRVEVLPFGATIKSISINNQLMTLTYCQSEQYVANPYYFGSTIGRYANRIANGQCVINNTVVKLATGSAQHALHGGEIGFSHRLWRCVASEADFCRLYYHSPDGENGFPGALDVYLTIRVSGLSVELEYQAISDKDSIISLTNHCYFNLNSDNQAATDHTLKISASYVLPCSSSGIPTGEIRNVANSVFDFQEPMVIAERLQQDDPNLQTVNGFDHYYVFAAQRDTALPVAELSSSKSGIKLQLYTSQPGVQFYAGNFLADPFEPRAGICLEAQHWPDAPNQPHFPSAMISAGETYRQFIRYQFSFLEK